jgi:hypothetical protein
VAERGWRRKSSLDTGDRALFANAGDANRLFRTGRRSATVKWGRACLCTALRARGGLVWRRLAARSVQSGLSLARAATTLEPTLCAAAGNRLLAPVLHDGGYDTFVLPPLPERTAAVALCRAVGAAAAAGGIAAGSA